MRKIRVLIVDDAVVIRRLLTDIISADPMLEVAGAAATGSIGIAKIPQINPDVVTLDVEMPGLSGLETLVEIRKVYPTLPVIMFSTLTERGAGATLDALASGASDYVTKPANVGSMTAGIQAVRDSLIPKIKALCGRVIAPSAAAPAPRLKTPGAGALVAPAMATRVDVLAIGVSTGGPNALAALLPQLPGDLPVPIVIVQHMPPVFTKLLAQRLDAKSPLRVFEGHDGARILPGTAWLAPGDRHVVVTRAGTDVVLRTNQEPPENSCRPAVDPLFRSVAEVYGRRSLGLILTGMGQDGLRGCEHLKEVGGQVLAQDEASCVVWGMPGAVAHLADRVLPLAELPLEILRRVRVGRAAVAAETGVHA